MTVIVKGMEMPECCGDCPFCKEIGEDIICSLTSEKTWETECGLVEIPEKHGKLIDGDEAKDYIKARAIMAFNEMFNNPSPDFDTNREQILLIHTLANAFTEFDYVTDSYLGSNE